MKRALIVSVLSALLVPTIRGEDASKPTQNLVEYADVLALQGTAKQEILAIAHSAFEARDGN